MDWIRREIITGMQRLTCLGLDREPASDLVEGTVVAWEEAVRLNRVWDEELDAPRFRQTFAILSATRKTWPSPADFLEVMPGRAPVQALPRPVCSPEQAKANLAKLQAILYGGSSD